MNLDSLLITDDAALLGVLRPALEKISVNIEVCGSSKTGNDLLANRKFDAVIIDCDDLQNGFDLLSALRQTQSNARSVTFAVVNAKTTNVSEGGMAIRVLGKLPKDVQAQFRFTLPGMNISLDLKGQVAWADGTGHIGIRFVEVPQSSQYQLEKWLTDHLQNEIPDRLQGYPALP